MKQWLITPLLCAALVLGGCAAQPTAPEEEGAGTSPAEINVQLGVAYMRKGNNEVALNKFKRALQQDPEFPLAHNAIAVLYERLGETDLADKHYREALALDPKNASAHNNYGQFLCRQDKYKEAEEHFLAAVSNPLYQTPERPYTNAGICARRASDPAKAEVFFRTALQANKRYAPALLEMAYLSVEYKNYLTARGYLERYIDVAPHNAATLLLGYRIERALGNNKTAADYALLLKAKFPESNETRQLLELERNDSAGR